MDPVSALTIAAVSAQFLEPSIVLLRNHHEYLKKVKNVPRRSRELHQEVCLVSKLFVDLKSELVSIPSEFELENAPTAVTETVSDFTKLMTEMTKRVEIKNAEFWKRAKWPFDEEENEAYLAKLERFKGTLALGL